MEFSIRSPRTVSSSSTTLTNRQFICLLKLRKQTDTLGLALIPFILLIFLVLTTYIGANENFHVLNYRYDSSGNICGVGPLKFQPYLFFLHPENCSIKSCDVKSICISDCPSRFWSLEEFKMKVRTMKPLEVLRNLWCTYEFVEEFSVDAVFDPKFVNNCATEVKPSQDIDKICVPAKYVAVTDEFSESYKKLVLKNLRKHPLPLIFTSIYKDENMLLAVYGVCCVIYFIWFFLIFIFPTMGVISTVTIFLLSIPIYMVYVVEKIKMNTFDISAKNLRSIFLMTYLCIFMIAWIIFISHAYQLSTVIDVLRETKKMLSSKLELLNMLPIISFLNFILLAIFIRLGVGLSTVYTNLSVIKNEVTINFSIPATAILIIMYVYCVSVLNTFCRATVSFYLSQIFWKKPDIDLYSTACCILKYHIGSIIIGSFFNMLLYPLHTVSRFPSFHSYKALTKYSASAYVIMCIYGGSFFESDTYLSDLTIFNKDRLFNVLAMLDQVLLYIKMSLSIIIGYILLDFHSHTLEGTVVALSAIIISYMAGATFTAFIEALINTLYVCLYECIDEDRYMETGYQRLGPGIHNVLLLPLLKTEITRRRILST